MLPPAVAAQIAEAFQTLPQGMKRVSGYVLDHPEDVALLSMRELARRLATTPATMTRFAQRLGYPGYDAFRQQFASTFRQRVSDFSDRAGRLAAQRELLGESPLAQSLANNLADRVAGLVDSARLSAIVDAAEAISGSPRVLCLGHRSCYAPAFHFAYVAGLYGVPTRLLDAPGGIGADPLNEISESDLLLAVASAPYSRATVELAAAAREHGATIVAVTDSDASPIARMAEHAVAVPNEMAGATSAATPILAAVEVLAALVVARSGVKGRKTLDRNEAGFAQRRVYWDALVEVSA